MLKNEHKKLQKQIRLECIYDHFKYVEISKNNISSYILIIGGWQIVRQILDELTEELESNVILFDFPGIGDNKHFKPESHPFNSEIMLEVITKLNAKYTISKVVGESAGSCFVVRNYNLFPKNAHFYLLSPQLMPQALDNIVYLIFKGLYKLSLITKKPVFSSVIRTEFIKNMWVSIVAKNSKREITYKFQRSGIENNNNFWTLQQFFDLYTGKKEFATNLQMYTTDFFDKRDFTFIIGDKDNLLNINEFVDFFTGKGLNKENFKIVNGSHVLELESVISVAEIINNHTH